MTPDAGLTSQEAARRLRRDGPNALPQRSRTRFASLIAEQFASLMTLILVGAALLSWLLGETADTAAILAIVLLNAVLGVVQEYRAERAIEAISRWSTPRARVVRDGRKIEVNAADLVVGDVLWLEAGDRVPSDARVVEGFSLQVEEAALTGESVPVSKVAQESPPEHATSPAEMPHMLFMGTTIVAGSARAVVVATGIRTELGAIAAMVAGTPKSSTPLQDSLEHLGRWLVAICAAAVIAVFGVGVAQGQPWLDMLMVSVGLAVAAIPEGLPAAVTAALAIGVQRMSRRRAIVRRLSAVETLGCASVICADKTGTLTRNEMTLTRIWGPWGRVEVTGTGFEPKGRFALDGRPVDPLAVPALAGLLAGAVACSHADVAPSPDGRRWVAVGDPTEAALACAARKAGLTPEQVARHHRPLLEAPFEARRRLMSVAVASPVPDSARVYAKGAPDAVLLRCVRQMETSGDRVLGPADRSRWMQRAETLAAGGLRVLAVATRSVRSSSLPPAHAPMEEAASSLERDLTFMGLVALSDPPRPDVAEAVERARQAHVRTLMITGDHPATAAAVARAIGLGREGERALVGAEIERLTDDELAERLLTTHVFARVSPSHKRRLVRLLKRQGEVVSMTGDGVNDAPALKEADIGVAMGLAGTDVARQAASLVLVDDNYATIVDAIEEGRAIYDNIRRFIRYLLGCNAGEVLTMLGAGLMGLPVPMTALQLLWINLVTDGLPALALGMIPPSGTLMHRPPRARTETLFARGAGEEILEVGLLIGLSTLLVFSGTLAFTRSLIVARSAAFTYLVFSQLIYAVRCAYDPQRPGGVAPIVVVAVGASFLMHLVVMSVGSLQAVFRTIWLPHPVWAGVLAALAGTLLLEWLGSRAITGRFFSRIVGRLRKVSPAGSA